MVKRAPRLLSHPRWRHISEFLCLGGASFLILATIALVYPTDPTAMAALLAASYTVSHFVNNPHFAHAYQLFLPGLVKALREPKAPLRKQYLFAGFGVPLLLALFYGTAIVFGSPSTLGIAVNAMLFAVGWHYAKQGYGVLMVACSDSGLRLAPEVRVRLLSNTYVAWIAIWLLANRQFAQHEYWGIAYVMVDIPDYIVFPAITVASLLFVRCSIDILEAVRKQRSFPANGLMAYLAAVYVWMLVPFVSPAAAIFVPAFHSLQYLSVAWRYRANLALEKKQSVLFSMARFVALGMLLGVSGFWWGPKFLDAHVPYDSGLFGVALFLFIGWISINIHHYFIDNVIWRRDNPDVRRLLLSPTAP